MSAVSLSAGQRHLMKRLAKGPMLWANLGPWGSCARRLEDRGLIERFALGKLKQKTALGLTDAGVAALQLKD